MIIDFSEIQDQVISVWIENNENYSYTETVTTDPCPMYQNYMRESYQNMLDDPMMCLSILGYNKLSDYMRDQNI